MSPIKVTPTSEVNEVGRQRLLFAVLVSLAIACFALVLHGDRSLAESAGLGAASWWKGIVAFTWVSTQSFLLMLPGLLLGFVSARRFPRASRLLSATWIVVVLVVVVLDAIVYRWIAERLFSAAVVRVAVLLPSPLAGHVSGGMMASATLLVGGLCALGTAAHLFSWRLTPVWSRSLPRLSVPAAAAYCLMGGILVSMPILIHPRLAWRSMSNYSEAHPWCAFRLVRHRGVGPPVPQGERLSRDVPPTLRTRIEQRDQQQRLLGVDLTAFEASRSSQQPDIVIVIIESFRPELVSQEVMPKLANYAENGIHCRQHFSAGNATNDGMFGILNGLEAIWFDRPIRYSPLLNRLFRQAGYELGFFAGHDDWREFLMDGFISEQHYDVFSVTEPDGLASDRVATQRAVAFLDERRSEQHMPRLCVLYLYSTHATYLSYARDQTFQPAADERFLMPYSPANRDRVWNRYKNSGRSVDRFISALVRPDRIVVVTGDHGEAFLEDGTCGHGVRLSRYQNMTPAVIHGPGVAARTIMTPTMHADLLPTLLDAAGITVSQPAAFDGVSLLTADPAADRIFVTRNFLSGDAALVGPWTVAEEQPFGYRASISLADARVTGLNAINPQGDEREATAEEISAVTRRWMADRFERSSVFSAPSGR